MGETADNGEESSVPQRRMITHPVVLIALQMVLAFGFVGLYLNSPSQRLARAAARIDKLVATKPDRLEFSKLLSANPELGERAYGWSRTYTTFTIILEPSRIDEARRWLAYNYFIGSTPAEQPVAIVSFRAHTRYSPSGGFAGGRNLVTGEQYPSVLEP